MEMVMLSDVFDRPFLATHVSQQLLYSVVSLCSYCAAVQGVLCAQFVPLPRALAIVVIVVVGAMLVLIVAGASVRWIEERL